MLTIKSIGKGSDCHKYYADYAQGYGESRGQWHGIAAFALGLEGKFVVAGHMESVLRGYSPDGKALCSKPGSEHRGGWDLTWSAPKSVSILWSNANKNERVAIEEAQARAVAAGMEYIQKHAAYTRVGEGGRDREHASLIFATFGHSSNRAQEPQLHTHAVVFNVCQTDFDRKWRTVESREMYRGQRTAAAYYKAALAQELQKIGYCVERTPDSFEVIGVPKEVCQAQSSRSQAIEAALAENNLTRESASAAAKEIAALKTRERKQKTETKDFSRWQTENTAHGFGPKEQEQLFLSSQSIEKSISLSPEGMEQLAKDSLAKITLETSTFNLHDLHRKVAEESIGKQGAEGAKKTVNLSIQNGFAVEMGDYDDELRFSTPAMFALEQEMVNLVKERVGEIQYKLPDEIVKSIIAARAQEKKPMSMEQEAAFLAVTQDGNGVSLLRGVAGAGKSYTMGAVREAYTQTGYSVVGLAPTNKAAQGLEASTGIPSQSIDAFLFHVSENKIEIDSKTVIVVDEAGMNDSRKTLLLAKIAKEKSSKIILVGDEKQIQPIMAGQAFGSLIAKMTGRQLSEVRRQTDPLEATAILASRDGKVNETIKFLLKNGRLSLENDRKEAEKMLMKRWVSFTVNENGEKNDKTSLILASKNSSVERLNAMARGLLKEKGILKEGIEFETRHGTIEVSVGDLLIFSDSRKRDGIFRSEIIKVKEVTETKITVEKENGNTIRFNPKTFGNFRHGYAVTAHKSQGTTVDRSFVFFDGHSMDREKFYVSLSRGREGNEVFADKETLGGLRDYQEEKLELALKEERADLEARLHRENLESVLNRSHKKDTTQDYGSKSSESWAIQSGSRKSFEESWKELRESFTHDRLKERDKPEVQHSQGPKSRPKVEVEAQMEPEV